MYFILFLVGIDWTFGKTTLHNSFLASTRSKYSPSLFAPSSLTRSGLRFQPFYQRLGRNFHFMSSHISTHCSVQCHRLACHHGDTAIIQDLTPPARETVWKMEERSSSSLWTTHRILHVFVAHIYFGQRIVSAVLSWMDADRGIDLSCSHARVATSQVDCRLSSSRSQSNRPISAIQRSSSCWRPVCLRPERWSTSYWSWSTDTTRKSRSSSIRCQCHVRRRSVDRQPSTFHASQNLRKSISRQYYLTNLIVSIVEQ